MFEHQIVRRLATRGADSGFFFRWDKNKHGATRLRNLLQLKFEYYRFKREGTKWCAYIILLIASPTYEADFSEY